MNIISFSGLILSVGLAIDNTIIIIDNIDQHIANSETKEKGIIIATNELIRPLLSSTITTSAVFIPLTTIGGISGVLFFDQAITITITLIISYVISITVVPTIFFLFCKNNYYSNKPKLLIQLYDSSLNSVTKRKVIFLIIFILLIPSTIFLYYFLDINKFPKINQNDFIAEINMNEPLTMVENEKRINSTLKSLTQYYPVSNSSQIGPSDFVFNNNQSNSNTSSIYIRNSKHDTDIDSIISFMKNKFETNFPQSLIKIQEPENAFNKIFMVTENKLILKLRHDNIQGIVNSRTYDLIKNISTENGKVRLSKYLQIIPNHEKLLMYDVEIADIIELLKIKFGGIEIMEHKGADGYYKVILSSKSNNLSSLQKTFITNKNNEEITLNKLIKTQYSFAPNCISSDEKGQFISIEIENMDKFKSIKKQLETTANKEKIEINYSGFYTEKQTLYNEFLLVMIVSITLLFLILAAQFESIVLPAIILFEVIFDIFGALLFLLLFKSDINIMSGLGILIMSGIVINDSIIKISAIDKEYRSGTNLIDAIKIGGHKRFNPIIMTSLTTILSMIPFIFLKVLVRSYKLHYP